MSTSFSSKDLLKQPVSYKEAALLLGIQKQSLANAINKGVLTPLPRRSNRQRGYVARQQLELFLTPKLSGDKKSLSLNDLTNSEAAQWHKIHREIVSLSSMLLSQDEIPQEEETPQEVEEGAIEIAVDLIERLSLLTADIIEELIIDKKITEYSPEGFISFITSSEKFKEVLSLMGVESLRDLSGESLKKLNEAAEKITSSFMLRISQLMLTKMMREAEEGETPEGEREMVEEGISA